MDGRGSTRYRPQRVQATVFNGLPSRSFAETEWQAASAQTGQCVWLRAGVWAWESREIEVADGAARLFDCVGISSESSAPVTRIPGIRQAKSWYNYRITLYVEFEASGK